MAVTILVTGCAQLIPCQKNLTLDIPAAQKSTDELTIRMTEELRRLDVIIKPVKMPLTTSYKFQIGKSLESNLTSAFQDIFLTTQISSLPMSNLANSPFVLEVELLSCDIHIGVSIASEHTANLTIRYSFYKEGRQMFILETKTDGASSVKPGELSIPVGINMSTAAGAGLASGIASHAYKQAIGRAYDEALAKSVSQLAGKIPEVVIK
jgi:hypothetical protein